MSVDTKGLVVGNHENQAFEVIAKVKEALKSVKTTNVLGTEVSASVFAHFTIDANVKMIQCHFKDGDQNRTLSIHFDCHTDGAYLHKGDKLTFSMGCFGNSVEIMRSVLEQFDGERYLVPSDASDEIFEKL